MAVETTLNRKVYSGDGVSTAFPTTFQFLAAADLAVVQRVTATGVETVKTLTTDYTVSGGSGDVGTVTMLVAPPTGTQLTIYNDPAVTQSLDLLEGDISPAEAKERAWDRLTFIAQRLKDRIDRSVRLSEGFAGTFDLTLPDLAPDTVLKVNAGGDGFEDGPSAADIADAQANAAAAAASAVAAAASVSSAAGQATAAAASAVAAAASAVAAAGYATGAYPTVLKTANYTFLVTDRVIIGNPTGGSFTVTLPTAVGITGQLAVIKHSPANVGANTLSVGTTSAQTIEGVAAPYVLSEPGQYVQLISDGANWTIIAAG